MQIVLPNQMTFDNLFSDSEKARTSSKLAVGFMKLFVF